MLWREELQVRGVTIMCGGWEVIYGECYSLASWECPHCYDTPECLNYGLASRERGGEIKELVFGGHLAGSCFFLSADSLSNCFNISASNSLQSFLSSPSSRFNHESSIPPPSLAVPTYSFTWRQSFIPRASLHSSSFCITAS